MVNKASELRTILTINTVSDRGGAARASYDMLCLNLKKRGFDTYILCSQSEDANNSSIKVLGDADKNIIEAFNEAGYLDLNHNSYKIKDLDCFKKADVVHVHNLHGGYFNPTFLPELTALKPTIWTLHDEQAITGHCAYSFSCERWKTGCGNCPDLNYYPSISKDTTKYLWELKKKLYEKSDFVIVTPSNWLKERVEASMLKGKDVRCIHNGIDENIWKPYPKEQARRELNLPQDKKILLFMAQGSIHNPQKGGQYVLDAVEYFKNRQEVLFLVVGHEESLDLPNVSTKGYVRDTAELIKYYSGADLFIFPTMADNLPFVVMESMACGTPVISFNIGGVPEEIQHMESGYLARYKDLEDFIRGIELFLDDDALRNKASKAARKQFLEKFTLDKCLDNYVSLYKQVYENRLKHSHAESATCEEDLKRSVESLELNLRHSQEVLSETQAKVAITSNALRSATDELNNIKHSRSWKMVLALRKLVNMFFPDGSMRRKIAEALCNSIKMITSAVRPHDS